jgi:hypothetical protein
LISLILQHIQSELKNIEDVIYGRTLPTEILKMTPLPLHVLLATAHISSLKGDGDVYHILIHIPITGQQFRMLQYLPTPIGIGEDYYIEYEIQNIILENQQGYTEVDPQMLTSFGPTSLATQPLTPKQHDSWISTCEAALYKELTIN